FIEVAQLVAGAVVFLPCQGGVEALYIHAVARQVISAACGLAGIGILQPAAAVAAVVVAEAVIHCRFHGGLDTPTQVYPGAASAVTGLLAPGCIGVTGGSGGIVFAAILGEMEILVKDPVAEGE